MKITVYYEPFEHIMVEDFYDENELKLLWREFEFLLEDNKLFDKGDVGSPITDGESLRKGIGIYLDQAYNHRRMSDILTINRKIYDNDFTKSLSDISLLGKYLRYSMLDNTLLSVYRDGGYYKAHRDNATCTIISWHWKKPAKFEGGSLFFPDYNLTIDPIDNALFIFPSCILHAVLPIKSTTNKLIENRISLINCTSQNRGLDEINEFNKT